MIGILTKNQAFVAQTNHPLILEPISFYEYSQSLLPKNYLSISKKYHVEPKLNSAHSINEFLPVYPNEELVEIDVNLAKISYVSSRKELMRFTSGDHIYSLIPQILKSSQQNTLNCSWIIFLHDHAVVFTKKFNSLIFHQIFIYQFVEELLYVINRIYKDFQMNEESDQLIFLGEVEKKQNAYSIFQNYFRNIILEDYNPLILAN
ncbi:MAG: DUF3822 family protein [Saprospiraceae bacterium]